MTAFKEFKAVIVYKGELHLPDDTGLFSVEIPAGDEFQSFTMHPDLFAAIKSAVAWEEIPLRIHIHEKGRTMVRLPSFTALNFKGEPGTLRQAFHILDNGEYRFRQFFKIDKYGQNREMRV